MRFLSGFCLGKDEHGLPSTPVSAPPITHLILILPGVLHCDWMIKVRLEEIGHNCFDKNFTCIFYKPNLWDGESTREPSLHVVLPGPAGEGVEGPQHRVWEVPGRSRPLHVKFSGQRYLNLFNPWPQRYLLILSMIKIFLRSCEDDKNAGHEYSG